MGRLSGITWGWEGGTIITRAFKDGRGNQKEKTERKQYEDSTGHCWREGHKPRKLEKGRKYILP